MGLTRFIHLWVILGKLLEAVTTNEDIKDVAAANPSLRTLANLIDEGDLEDTLEDGGLYTFFAPSDQAFTAIPQATPLSKER